MTSFSFNSGAKRFSPAAIVSWGKIFYLPFNFKLAQYVKPRQEKLKKQSKKSAMFLNLTGLK